MPDIRIHDAPPPDWHDAFAALPLEEAPADGWPRLAARLDARRRAWFPWLATAAALVLAVALPWHLLPGRIAAPSAPDPTTRPVTSEASLDDLYAESARLEALLDYARDDRVSSGSAATVAAQLDGRIAAIDAALMQPRLSPQLQRALWTQRVATLRALTGFESNRRWLSARGERYDGALARVD